MAALRRLLCWVGFHTASEPTDVPHVWTCPYCDFETGGHP